MTGGIAILKLDDFGIVGRRATFMYMAVDLLTKLLGLKVCWGVMGERISMLKSDSRIIRMIKRFHRSGRHSFWNHGWTHSDCEFKCLGEESAIDHILKTQNVIAKIVGVAADTFGAPCNVYNEETKCALEKCGNIKYWFYGDGDFNGICFPFFRNLEGKYLKLESTLYHPDYERIRIVTQKVFVKGGGAVIQAHPAFWHLRDLFSFARCMIYLKIHGVKTKFPCELDKETVYTRFPKTIGECNE